MGDHLTILRERIKIIFMAWKLLSHFMSFLRKLAWLSHPIICDCNFAWNHFFRSFSPPRVKFKIDSPTQKCVGGTQFFGYRGVIAYDLSDKPAKKLFDDLTNFRFYFGRLPWISRTVFTHPNQRRCKKMCSPNADPGIIYSTEFNAGDNFEKLWFT